MHAEDIRKVLTGWGWKEDRWGHMQKTTKAGDKELHLRVKIQARSVRFERKLPEGLGWQRMDSAYFTRVCLVGNGRALRIGRYIIKQPARC